MIVSIHSYRGGTGKSNLTANVATAVALSSGVLPPTANYSEPDPECDLDVIPNIARKRQVEYAMSNSFAFGGLNAVLVLKAV